MSNLILKDESVETTHGHYECPECERTFYAGGIPLHKPSCSKAGEDRYAGLIHHVGPNCPEYAEAVDAGDLRPRAFNMGYDVYPNDRGVFGRFGTVFEWYEMGWQTARMHESPACSYRSESYPYGDQLPHKVRMLTTVKSDLPCMTLAETAVQGEVYEVYTNSHGALSIYLPSGARLGVKPGEFEIVEWYDDCDKDVEEKDERTVD